MPPIVTVERLQSLRQMREENMLFRCDFEAMTLIPDPAGTGGKIEDWAVVSGLSDLPCSTVAMNGSESLAAQQVAPASNAFVIVPWRYGGLIRAKYRVVVRGTIDTVDFVETYGIIYVAVPKTFSVQTTIFARSGVASSGTPRLAMAGRMAASAEQPSGGSGLGNVDRLPQPGPRSPGPFFGPPIV